MIACIGRYLATCQSVTQLSQLSWACVANQFCLQMQGEQIKTNILLQVISNFCNICLTTGIASADISCRLSLDQCNAHLVESMSSTSFHAVSCAEA